MLAIGGLLVCAAVMTLAAIGPVFRRDNPPRWTTYRWVGELVTLAIVCAVALGLASFGAGAIAAFQTGPDYLDLALLAGVVLIAVIVRRWWKARARPEALDSAADLRVVDVPDAPGGVRTAPPEPAVASPSASLPPHRAA